MPRFSYQDRCDFERVVEDPTEKKFSGEDDGHLGFEKWTWRGRSFGIARNRRGQSKAAGAAALRLYEEAASGAVQREAEIYKKKSQEAAQESSMNEFMMLLGKSKIKNSARGELIAKAALDRKRIRQRRRRAEEDFRHRAGRPAAIVIQCWWRRVRAKMVVEGRRRDRVGRLVADASSRETRRKVEAESFIKTSAKIYEGTWKIPIDFVGYAGGVRGVQYDSILGKDRGAHVVVHQTNLRRQNFHFLFHVQVTGLWQLEAFRTFDAMDMQAALLPLFGDSSNCYLRRHRTADSALREWAHNGGNLDRGLLLEWLLQRARLVVRVADDNSLNSRSIRVLSSRLHFDAVLSGSLKVQ